MSVRLFGIKNEFHLLQISPSGGTCPDHLLHSTKLCFTEDQSQMLIFIILSFLDHLSLGKKRIIVKLIQNSPFLCLLSISQHIFPHLLQQKLGVIFFPTGLTLFYFQEFLFSGNALMLRTSEYTDLLLNSHGLCPKSHPPPQTFSTWTEGGRIKGGREEGRQRGKVCVCACDF